MVVVALVVAALLLSTIDVALAARVRVRAGSERWRPAHLFITAGDTVVWKNPDDRRHNVVAYGGGWGFNETLRSRSVRVRCTLHSAIVDGRCEGMCGLVHVFTS